MDKKDVARINELARKNRTIGLTEAEAAEQKHLRAQYLREVRENMEQTLKSIRIEQEDGTYQPIKKKQ